MATFVKRGSAWRAEIVRTVDGKRHRISKTFKTKALAQGWAIETESELLGIIRTGATGRLAKPGEGGTTLSDTLTRYRNEVSPTKRGQRWEQLRIDALLRDFPDFCAIKLPKLTPEAVANWRDQRLAEVSAGTVNREMNLLSGVIEHARREWRIISTNPVRDVRRPPQPKGRDVTISDEQASEIVEALGFDGKSVSESASAEVGLAFLLAIETGMRAGEIVGLKRENIHLKERWLRLDKTKNGDARDVPLTSRAVQLIKLALKRDRDDPRVFSVSDQARDALYRKYRPADLRHINFHDSRHEATRRLSKKMDVLSLARTLGHRDLKSLMTYYNETAAEIAKKLG